MIQMFGDTSTVGTVQANNVNLTHRFFQYENFSIIFNVTHLVEKSRCTIFLSQIADLLDGSNTATHKVNVLKSDDLVRFLRILFEFSLQIQEIIILGNNTFSTRVTHALDHGSMVHGIGEQDTRRKFSIEGRQGGPPYSFKYDWIIAYVKMIIGTPYLHLICNVSNGGLSTSQFMVLK